MLVALSLQLGLCHQHAPQLFPNGSLILCADSPPHSARKLDKGILIVRFELPYNIWWYVYSLRLSISSQLIFTFFPTCAELPQRPLQLAHRPRRTLQR